MGMLEKRLKKAYKEAARLKIFEKMKESREAKSSN